MKIKFYVVVKKEAGNVETTFPVLKLFVIETPTVNLFIKHENMAVCLRSR